MTHCTFKSARRTFFGGVLFSLATPVFAKNFGARNALEELCMQFITSPNIHSLGTAHLAQEGMADITMRLTVAFPVNELNLPQRFKSTIRAEFLAGDIVQIDGWFMSRTEADAMALGAALS